MNLHHKALRHFISASVIVLTSSFLIYELIASDRAMNAYMRYIMERADSSFLYDKYQNQSIAAHLMRTFEAPGDPVTAEKRRARFATPLRLFAARFATPLRLLTVRTAST
ncbi:Putative two-component response regulator and GGDEF family protein YeaJ [Salmonella enterica subsp. enterica serovar Minnesota str. A4-603]|nr:Putative two-component response regulator and GGDEF family protein YeaJ [Salmonella enterica subsp. enterica serovar Minnesota str. A4-603]